MGAALLGESIYAIVGFAVLEATNFSGTLTGLSAFSVVVILSTALVGAVCLPALSALIVKGAALLFEDPRNGAFSHALIGAYLAAAVSGVVGVLYAELQSTYNLSGTPETIGALSALAFQLVAIPVGATIGLHWGMDVQRTEYPVEKPGDMPPNQAPPPTLPVQPSATRSGAYRAPTFNLLQIHFG